MVVEQDTNATTDSDSRVHKQIINTSTTIEINGGLNWSASDISNKTRCFYCVWSVWALSMKQAWKQNEINEKLEVKEERLGQGTVGGQTLSTSFYLDENSVLSG